MTAVDAWHPTHDAVPVDLAPVSVIASWEPGTFLENLAPGPDRSWWVTSPSHHRVDLIGPDGALWARVGLEHPATGIVADGDGALVASGELGSTGWRLVRVEPSGTAETVADLGDVVFANGMVVHRGELLVAECVNGALAVVDLDVGRTTIVRHDARWTPLAPDAPMPGINGLAVDPSGDLMTTVSARSLVLRLHGEAADGEMTVAGERLVGDDLAVTADGTAYIATHTYHSVLRLRPDGTRHDVATHTQGVTGPTSVRVDPDGRSLVVTTTGGLLSPPSGGVEPARLLRIELQTPNHPAGAPTVTTDLT